MHQLQLELQNEELRRMQAKLEAARRRSIVGAIAYLSELSKVTDMAHIVPSSVNTLFCPKTVLKRDNLFLCNEDYSLSQKAVELLIGRLVTDDQFRQMARTSLDKACYEVGLELTPMEMLSQMEFDCFADFSSCLNPGLRRAGCSIGN